MASIGGWPGRRARTGGGDWAWRAIEPVRPIVRRRAGIPAAGGACAKPGGGGLPSPPQLLKAAIAGFSSSAVSALGGSALGGSEGSWPPILVGFDMGAVRQFRKGWRKE